ncbi:MAG TPA: hypothetical protein VNX68_13870, partial [Nitrosopumilaceae archaeon]|nr:hypothetical protein [Nitrosopumilaceae archaeon]
YLAVPQATSVLNDAIAAHIAAIVTGVPLGATISLWYTKDVSLPSTVVSHQSLVATLDANGTPLTFHGNWLPVPRLPNQPASFTIDVINTTNFNDYDFNGWNLNGIADVNLATYFAIVIGTASVTSGNTLRIGSVGLCHGMIATRPGAQTADEVLRECQYYYEQSYLNGSPPSATFVGSTIVPVSLTEGSPSDTLSTRSFTLTYKEVKIRFIVPTFYSPATGSINHIVAAINTAGTGEATVDVPISNWTAISNTPSSYSLQATTGGSVIGALTSINNEGLNIFQYIADARLGI